MKPQYKISVCVANVTGPYSPIILIKKNHRVVYPNSAQGTYIRAENRASAILFCPGTTIMVPGNHIKLDHVIATCNATAAAEVKVENIYRWSEISCKEPTRAEITNTPLKCNEVLGAYYTVYFNLSNDPLTIFSVCFSRRYSIPLYTRHVTLTKASQKFNVDSVKPKNYKDSGFYSSSFNISDLYRVTSQRATINGLLRIDLASDRYISSKNYLVMTYLTPSLDFLIQSYRNATYRYVNTVPQWRSIKYGNWFNIENEVRNFCHQHGHNLHIWTGVYGILRLPSNKDGKMVNLYLKNKIGNTLIIPLIFWKLIYSTKINKGVVLITVNNPYIKTATGLVICKDISTNSTFLKFKSKRNALFGFSYACSTVGFLNEVQGFPDLDLLRVKRPM